MFTGLIEEVGTVAAVRAGNQSARLQIAAPQIAKRFSEVVNVDHGPLFRSPLSDDRKTSIQHKGRPWIG